MCLSLIHISRRAVSTGLNQVVGKINEENAEKLGTNYFEVSFVINLGQFTTVLAGQCFQTAVFHEIAEIVQASVVAGDVIVIANSLQFRIKYRHNL